MRKAESNGSEALLTRRQLIVSALSAGAGALSVAACGHESSISADPDTYKGEARERAAATRRRMAVEASERQRREQEALQTIHGLTLGYGDVAWADSIVGSSIGRLAATAKARFDKDGSRWSWDTRSQDTTASFHPHNRRLTVVRNLELPRRVMKLTVTSAVPDDVRLPRRAASPDDWAGRLRTIAEDMRVTALRLRSNRYDNENELVSSESTNIPITWNTGRDGSPVFVGFDGVYGEGDAMPAGTTYEFPIDTVDRLLPRFQSVWDMRA